VVVKIVKEPLRLLDRPGEEISEISGLASNTSADDLLRLHHGFADGYDAVVRSGQPRAAFEMLLVRLARRPPLVPIDVLVERLSRLERRLSSPAPPRAPVSSRAPTSAPPTRPAFSGHARESDSGPRKRTEPSDERKEPPAEGRRVPRAPPEIVASPGSEPDLESVFRSLVGRVAAVRPELAAKLEHAVLIEAGAGRVVLAWPPDSMFGKLVAEADPTALIERAASELFGTPTQIVHELDSPRTQGRKTLSHLEAEARELRRKDAYERVRHHPRVEEALEIFGARVRDVRLSGS
jgi:DNA polymerase-3 subunit gamma/tau